MDIDLAGEQGEFWVNSTDDLTGMLTPRQGAQSTKTH
jgi:hypothetical protein